MRDVSVPPRVGPSAAHVLREDPPGLDPRVTWTPMSRRSGVPTSSPIAAAMLDWRTSRCCGPCRRSWESSLLAEDVPALLDPAGEQHVAVDPKQNRHGRDRLADLVQGGDGPGFPGDRHRAETPTIEVHGQSRFVGKASSWLKEERRKTSATGSPSPGPRLRAAILRGVGEAELPAACPQCEGEMRWRRLLQRPLHVGVHGGVRGVRRGGLARASSSARRSGQAEASVAANGLYLFRPCAGRAGAGRALQGSPPRDRPAVARLQLRSLKVAGDSSARRGADLREPDDRDGASAPIGRL